MSRNGEVVWSPVAPAGQGALVTSCAKHDGATHAAAAAAKYHCPISGRTCRTKPGSCPICMSLTLNHRTHRKRFRRTGPEAPPPAASEGYAVVELNEAKSWS